MFYKLNGQKISVVSSASLPNAHRLVDLPVVQAMIKPPVYIPRGAHDLTTKQRQLLLTTCATVHGVPDRIKNIKQPSRLSAQDACLHAQEALDWLSTSPNVVQAVHSKLAMSNSTHQHDLLGFVDSLLQGRSLLKHTLTQTCTHTRTTGSNSQLVVKGTTATCLLAFERGGWEGVAFSLTRRL
jgi:hypothetical protein